MALIFRRFAQARRCAAARADPHRRREALRSMRFAQKSKVTPYERTHTGEKLYVCSMCPSRFTNKSDVPKHERTHTGEIERR